MYSKGKPRSILGMSEATALMRYLYFGLFSIAHFGFTCQAQLTFTSTNKGD